MELLTGYFTSMLLIVFSTFLIILYVGFVKRIIYFKVACKIEGNEDSYSLKKNLCKIYKNDWSSSFGYNCIFSYSFICINDTDFYYINYESRFGISGKGYSNNLYDNFGIYWIFIAINIPLF